MTQNTDVFAEQLRRTLIWEGLKLIQQKYPEIKVVGATVDFSGSGDDGSMDSEPCLVIDQHQGVWHEESYKAFRANSLLTKSIMDEVELIYDKHGGDWPDWVNNEGGNGSIQFILDGEGSDGNTYKEGVCVTVWTNEVIQHQNNVFSEGALDKEPKPEEMPQ